MAHSLLDVLGMKNPIKVLPFTCKAWTRMIRSQSYACILFLLSLLATGAAQSAIIYPDRVVDWANSSGIPGGIPNATTIYKNAVTDLGIDNTGATDVTSALQAAMDTCPAGQVLYLPQGTYLCSGLHFKQRYNSPTATAAAGHCIVRGDGMGKTVLKALGWTSMFTYDGGTLTGSLQNISAGATKGSTTVTVPDTSGVSVGSIVTVLAGTDPSYVLSVFDGGGSGQHMRWMHRVVSKTSSTVTFQPPLAMDLTAFNPQLLPESWPCIGAGVENLTIDIDDQGGMYQASIGFWGFYAWNCWVKNVECKNYPRGRFFSVSDIGQSNIFKFYAHGGFQGPGSEGLAFLESCSWNRIENGIIYNGGAIVFNDGGAYGQGGGGNAILYNFGYNHSSAYWAVADLDLGHFTQDCFNLVEGNVFAEVAGGDGYYGGASQDTLFRNWITDTHPTYIDNLVAVRLKHYNNYFSIIGNVIGTTAFPQTNNGLMDGGSGLAYGGYLFAPEVSNYDDGTSTHVQCIYEFGFPAIGNTSYTGTFGPTVPPDYTSVGADDPNNASAHPLDKNVKATTALHGNYDFFTRTQTWESDDTNVVDHTDHTLPTSLIYTSRPSYLPFSFPWPPIDPRPEKIFHTDSFTTTEDATPEDMPIPAVWAFYHKDENGIPVWPVNANVISRSEIELNVVDVN